MLYLDPRKLTCIGQEANPDFLNNQTLTKTQWVYLKQNILRIVILHLIVSQPNSNFNNRIVENSSQILKCFSIWEVF